MWMGSIKISFLHYLHLFTLFALFTAKYSFHVILTVLLFSVSFTSTWGGVLWRVSRKSVFASLVPLRQPVDRPASLTVPPPSCCVYIYQPCFMNKQFYLNSGFACI